MEANEIDRHLDELKVARRILGQVFKVFGGVIEARNTEAAWLIKDPNTHLMCAPVVPRFFSRRVDRYRVRRIYRACFYKWPEVEWDPFAPQSKVYTDVGSNHIFLRNTHIFMNYVDDFTINCIVQEYARPFAR